MDNALLRFASREDLKPRPFAAVGEMTRPTRESVLLVDTNPRALALIRGSLTLYAKSATSFEEARACLFEQPPDRLVTNSRLGSYNGLHLAYLVHCLRLPTRVIVYGVGTDLVCADEAKRVGAFYVPRPLLSKALPAYVAATLPPHDRRDVRCAERRSQPRGGRRITDGDARRVR